MNLNGAIFRCKDTNFAVKQGAKESPYVVNLPDKEILDDIDGKKFWGKFKAFVNANDKKEFTRTYIQKIKNSHETGTDIVHFILTLNGLEIGKVFDTKDDKGNAILRQTKLCLNKNPV